MDRQSNINNLKDLLKQSRKLRYLTQKSQRLSYLNSVFTSRLPSLLGQHCEVCDYHEHENSHEHKNSLIVQTSSQAVATQLRFTKPHLIASLQKTKAFKELKDIKISLAKPEATRQNQHKATKKPVSVINRNMIRQTAASLKQQSTDPRKRELAHALEKLARTLETNAR